MSRRKMSRRCSPVMTKKIRITNRKPATLNNARLPQTDRAPDQRGRKFERFHGCACQVFAGDVLRAADRLGGREYRDGGRKDEIQRVQYGKGCKRLPVV